MAASSGQCSLDESVINLKLIREHSVKELSDILSLVADPKEKSKSLVLDSSLAGPLGLVVEMTVLKELGVDRIFLLAPGQLNTESKHIIYLVRPKVKFMKQIVEHINAHKSANQQKQYYIYFVPRRRMMCERVLEEEGLYGSITVGEYHLDFLPFDSDVLSLEFDTSFKEVSLEGDGTSLYNCAKALMKLQFLYGIIPNIIGKGVNSKLITEMLFRMRREMASDEQQIIPEIDTLILMDREVDLITPMCTQLTYEGLVDEVFGVFNSLVELPASMVVDPKAQQQQPQVKDPALLDKKVKTPLNSNDKLFRDIRDLNFSVVGPRLNEKAKVIDKYYQQRHDVQTVGEIRDFISRLSTFQKEHHHLRIHTNIAETVLGVTRDPLFRQRLEAEQNLLALQDVDKSMDYIEECINKQEPLVKVLRLICLFSLTNNGLSEKQFNFLKKEILQTYGYKYLFTLENLTKLGLFKQGVTLARNNTYERLRRELNLIIEEMNEQDPKDIAYVYSGYAPISIRLIEKALSLPPTPTSSSSLQNLPQIGSLRNIAAATTSSTASTSSLPGVPGSAQQSGKKDIFSQESEIYPGWHPNLDPLLCLCSGPTFRARQTLPRGLATQETKSTSKVIMIFFVGGCTFTEISAIRFLSQKMEEFDFLIGTTKMINGNTILESVFERFGKEDTNPSS